MSDTVSVLVVDDQKPFRLAAKAVLARTDGFELAAEASGGDEAVAMAAQVHPDLVLMDINMPGTNGVEATRRIVEHSPGVVVFLCSTYDVNDLPVDAPQSGARAYVHKEHLGPDVLRELWHDRESGVFVAR
jgi:DNA-binding NarL/FixJ family response regulator